jgi:NAD(P)-dependent dehydrogenase (short-subunit alcohol dehydrogenase family)
MAKRANKGSGRLIRRKALIAGCDSGIGRAAAIAFAREAVDLIRAEERNWRGKELAGVPRAHRPLSHTI